jgi:hypothetical protein
MQSQHPHSSSSSGADMRLQLLNDAMFVSEACIQQQQTRLAALVRARAELEKQREEMALSSASSTSSSSSSSSKKEDDKKAKGGNKKGGKGVQDSDSDDDGASRKGGKGNKKGDKKKSGRKGRGDSDDDSDDGYNSDEGPRSKGGKDAKSGKGASTAANSSKVDKAEEHVSVEWACHQDIFDFDSRSSVVICRNSMHCCCNRFALSSTHKPHSTVHHLNLFW